MHYCEKCGKTLKDDEFYLSNNLEKFPPDGRLHTCKKCLTMHVDNWDPETFKWILEELDVPYVKEAWDDLLEKQLQKTSPDKITGLTVLGKYRSKMKLKQWKDYRWADSEKLEKESLEHKVLQMQSQGLTTEEIEEQLQMDRGPKRPKKIAAVPPPGAMAAASANNFYDDEQEDEFEDQLTEEDKTRLRLKWGRSYSPDEWVRLEQLYQDMMNSYDIQGAGHKDTLIMICKASLKANQCIDAGDLDSFQKVSRVYDSLMKSGRFTAAQIKAEDSDSLDSIGELVALCEKEGFIPRYYVEQPNDQVDRTLQDMQNYTRTLVTEELNLGNMLEAAIRDIEEDRAKEAIIETDDSDMDEEEKLASLLFDSENNKETTYEDYEEFEEFKQSLRKQDEEELNGSK